MSAYPDGGPTVYRRTSTYHGCADGSTTNGDVCIAFEFKTTTTNTNFSSATCNKWDDSPKVKWYSYEAVAPPKQEAPKVVYYEAPHPWELGAPIRQRVQPQLNVRDDRPAVWACRPRHGLSGK